MPRAVTAALGLSSGVLLAGCFVALDAAQAPPRVQFSLREVSAASVSCTLDVTSNATAGEAILNCQRTDPASHLGAHRPLTATEAARLVALATQMRLRPRQPGAPPAPRAAGAQATLMVTRGTSGLSVDVTQAPTGLSAAEREAWQMLRALADELRGVKR